MFDQFYGDINGHNIYDESSLDQEDYYNNEEFSNSKGYYKMEQDDYSTRLHDEQPTKQEPAPKILEGEIKRETEKAILFKFGESENWLPKSQINIKKKKEGVSIEIPAWLWDKMNQIEE